MISNKRRHQLDWVFNIALVALLFNMAIPAQAKTPSVITPAKEATAPTVPAVIVVTPLPVVPDKPPVVRQTMTIRSTAYSSTRDQTDANPFITASGSRVHDGTVAMNGLPFGTKVRIPQYYGDKVFTVEDRMNAKWGKKRVDIWMPSRELARQWGVRTVTVEVL